MLEEPGLRRMLERMGSFSRLIVFDRRGSGMSDPLPDDFTLEQECGDVNVVLDAAGSERTALFGYTGGGALAAAVRGALPGALPGADLLRRRSSARWRRPGTSGPRRCRSARERFAAQSNAWGTGSILPMVAASMADDERMRSWLGRMERASLSPGSLRRMIDYQETVDARAALPEINVPTLVMHRTDDPLIDVRHSRYIAENLPGARLVEFPGSDDLPSAGDSEALLGEMEEFLTGGRRGGMQRAMLTVLFTDIVDSTGHAARLGDSRWRDLLASQEEVVREIVERFGGYVVKTIGDAFLITFDGPPSSGLRCARAVVDAVRPLGLELHVGLHTGECEIIGDDVGGMAVHIASRVAHLADARRDPRLRNRLRHRGRLGPGLHVEGRGSAQGRPRPLADLRAQPVTRPRA